MSVEDEVEPVDVDVLPRCVHRNEAGFCHGGGWITAACQCRDLLRFRCCPRDDVGLPDEWVQSED